MREPQTNLAWNVLLDLSGRRGALHERLTAALREAIRAGHLPPGAALPPSRVLAADLSVSRWTVTRAYTQLATEGYLRARTGSATRVRWTPGSGAPQAPAVRRAEPAPARFDMTPGRPDLRAFPVTRWVEAIKVAAATASYEQLGYPEPGGARRLRDVLADYLNRVRGTVAGAADITVCLRSADAMGRVCRALAAAGATHLAVEDPGWPPMGEAAALAGLVTVPLPVDRDGLRADLLPGHPRVTAVCVGASHQFPAGAVLSPDRRAQLLEWAESRAGVIIEDDYDAEFRYDRPAVSALQGMSADRVVLLGSVSKTLAPAVGIGWVTTPPWLTAAVRAASPFPLAPPTLHQLALATFIETGGYDRYLRAARKRYQARRRLLLDALAARLPGCPVEGAAAGLHLVLRLPPGTGAARVVTAAAARGLLVADLDRFRVRPDAGQPGLVLGYGNLGDSAAAEAVSVLAEVLAEVSG